MRRFLLAVVFLSASASSFAVESTYGRISIANELGRRVMFYINGELTYLNPGYKKDWVQNRRIITHTQGTRYWYTDYDLPALNVRFDSDFGNRNLYISYNNLNWWVSSTTTAAYYEFRYVDNQRDEFDLFYVGP